MVTFLDDLELVDRIFQLLGSALVLGTEIRPRF